jgi:hypothetical protein
MWKLDYTLNLRARQLTFGKLDQPGTRIPYRLINGRMAVSTNLGALVLDSGADRLVLFGMKADLGVADELEMRTFTGSQKIGMASSKLLTIAGRRIWQGSAVAIPNQPEPEVDGLLPLSLFRAIYVCKFGTLRGFSIDRDGLHYRVETHLDRFGHSNASHSERGEESRRRRHECPRHLMRAQADSPAS